MVNAIDAATVAISGAVTVIVSAVIAVTTIIIIASFACASFNRLKI